jgi:hypothetical protein
MADTAAKLKHLLPHWVEHNASHLEAFRQWQRRARDQGLDAVADALEETVDAAQRADAALRRATRAIAGAD